MLEYLFLNGAILSASGLIYLYLRAIPRMEEKQASRWENLVFSDWPDRADKVVSSIATKFLRRVRVSILKIDNKITSGLENFKAKEKKSSIADIHDLPKDEEGKE